jgi:hypothetical protein
METPKFDVGGMTYGGQEAAELRRKLIEKRNECLGPDKFDADMAVILSHTIGLLAGVIPHVWPDMTAEMLRPQL